MREEHPRPGAARQEPPSELRRGGLHDFKNEFLATVSHEMRTPLSVIMGYVQIIKEGTLGPLTDQQKKAMDTILSRSEDLLRVLTQILRAREAHEGKSEIRLGVFELRTLLKRMLAKPYRDRERKGMAIECRFSQQELWVRADSQRIAEVMDNLLLNAFKFGPESSAVLVEARAENGQAVVSVRDTGPGLAPDQRTKIFEPFSATEQGLTREYGGLGLGLFLCREVLSLHGGNIWLDPPESGTGCVAKFSLPLAAGPRNGADPAAQAAGKRRVLVVEDDPDLTQLLVIFLSKLGDSAEVVCAESGLEALRRIRENVPHLIILDLLLPGMDGLAIIERLRRERETAEVRVLVMTGYEKGADMVPKTALQDVIMKPFDEAAFSAKIAQMLPRAKQP